MTMAGRLRRPSQKAMNQNGINPLQGVRRDKFGTSKDISQKVKDCRRVRGGGDPL